MSPSESPYDRHGAPVSGDDAPAEHELSGSPRELLFQIAHRHLGEWREWRRIAEETGVVDPLDLYGGGQVDSPLIVPFELDADPTATEDEDLTDELGFKLDVVSGTGELEGEGKLEVTDTDYEAYELTFTAPGDATAGPAQPVDYGRLHDVNGAEATPEIRLPSEGYRYTLQVELDHKLWLVLWLRRELPVYLDPEILRYTVLVPDVELPRGRGE